MSAPAIIAPEARAPAFMQQGRPRQLATLIYALVLLASVGVIGASLLDLQERSATLAAATDLLEQIKARQGAKPPDSGPTTPAVVGSPFLEGKTVTIAGAVLQQRVVAAVKLVDGAVLSSQVDLKGSEASKGFVRLAASIDIEQASLQQMLYDLEAGMPFLFVDQLTIQTPSGNGADDKMKLRVLLNISGRWRGPP